MSRSCILAAGKWRARTSTRCSGTVGDRNSPHRRSCRHSRRRCSLRAQPTRVKAGLRPRVCSAKLWRTTARADCAEAAARPAENGERRAVLGIGGCGKQRRENQQPRHGLRRAAGQITPALGPDRPDWIPGKVQTAPASRPAAGAWWLAGSSSTPIEKSIRLLKIGNS